MEFFWNSPPLLKSNFFTLQVLGIGVPDTLRTTALSILQTAILFLGPLTVTIIPEVVFYYQQLSFRKVPMGISLSLLQWRDYIVVCSAKILNAQCFFVEA